MSEVPSKRCNRGEQCVHPNGPALPLDQFSRSADRKDGRREVCKVCRSFERRWRRKNDPDHRAKVQAQEEARRERMKARRDSDPVYREHHRQYKRDWVKRRRDSDDKYRKMDNARSAARQRFYRATNEAYRQRQNARGSEYQRRDYVRERLSVRNRRKWRTDPDFRKRVMARSHRYRKTVRDPRNFTAADVDRIYKAQKGCCYYCGIQVGDTYHIDHKIPLDQRGSNSPENIVVACPPCNLKKGNRTPEQWGWYTSCPII